MIYLYTLLPEVSVSPTEPPAPSTAACASNEYQHKYNASGKNTRGIVVRIPEIYRQVYLGLGQCGVASSAK